MYNLEAIDSLLKNELSAMASYRQVFDKFQDDDGFSESAFLVPIYEGHKNAVTDLQIKIRELGGTPANHPFIDGAWTKINQDGANRLDKQAALSILQQGKKTAQKAIKRYCGAPIYLCLFVA